MAKVTSFFFSFFFSSRFLLSRLTTHTHLNFFGQSSTPQPSPQLYRKENFQVERNLLAWKSSCFLLITWLNSLVYFNSPQKRKKFPFDTTISSLKVLYKMYVNAECNNNVQGLPPLEWLPDWGSQELPLSPQSHLCWQLVPYRPMSQMDSHSTPANIGSYKSSRTWWILLRCKDEIM